MLETIGAAVFKWIIGEALDNVRLKLRREPYVRDLDRVVREAVTPAVTVLTDDPAVQESLSAALMERLTTQLDPMTDALQDPAACVRRWLAPLCEPVIGRRTYWHHMGLDRDSVVDAVTAKVLGGITDNAPEVVDPSSSDPAAPRSAGSGSWSALECRYDRRAGPAPASDGSGRRRPHRRRRRRRGLR